MNSSSESVPGPPAGPVLHFLPGHVIRCPAPRRGNRGSGDRPCGTAIAGQADERTLVVAGLEAQLRGRPGSGIIAPCRRCGAKVSVFFFPAAGPFPEWVRFELGADFPLQTSAKPPEPSLPPAARGP